jgi:GT2 family glycosyltransferase
MDDETRADDRCTIVVATRDRHEQLAATLPRHLALPERPRVIVVDDGSAEPVVAPGAEVLTLSRGAGDMARNAGARASSTPYVAFTDDDAWWDPGALRTAADLLDANPRLAVVQPHVLVGAATRDDPTCAEMRASPLPTAPGQPGSSILSFIACAVVVRREALLACGGFSERLGIGGEEQVLSWDLVAAGWQLSYIPDVTAHHDPPPAPDGRPARQTATIRNALWTLWLRRPLSAAARGTAAALAQATHDRTTAHALRDAIVGGSWILRERRVNPPHVEEMCRALARGPDARRAATRGP